ncbi:response regulator [Parasulfitobacter algicola]|uniref:Response regulator n=1 Tax=Parasulfitobacter algicola TaxID=2614809 RepID=A0ABX2IWW6_9RHOB|nr:response regulator [Sulfitobacter algicola]NSX54623.1 response regulator [Sulfitobacter algicola]
MRALIVEDDPIICELWTDSLESAGFEVVTCNGAKAAFPRLLEQKYDLFILDLFVEDGNTISLSDTITIRHPNAPIIMITGSSAFPNGDHRSVASGVDWILRKPVMPSELEAIATYLTKDTNQIIEDLSQEVFH